MPLDHGVAFDRDRVDQRKCFCVERTRWRLHPAHRDFLKVLILRFLQARHERVVQVIELRSQMPLHQRRPDVEIPLSGQIIENGLRELGKRGADQLV